MTELDRHLDHVLVFSGQNYDPRLSEVIFSELEIRRPDHYLEVSRGSAAEAIADVIARFDTVLKHERPDAVLIYGDTNSALGAIAAKRRRIPVFHMEAGNRCFDARVPEEMNRRVLDHISDVNMTNSEHARRYLLAEGLSPDRVIMTGSPMREILEHCRPGIDASQILTHLGLDARRYLVVSAHREENVDDVNGLVALVECLRSLAEVFSVPVIVSTHPRTRRRLDAAELKVPPSVLLSQPFGFFDYIRLQSDAMCVISDSGTLTEEASILGFPAVMIREAHERPEGIDVGVVPFVAPSADAVTSVVKLVLDQARPKRHGNVSDYAPADVSTVVVRLIVSYVQYVRRTVWFGALPVYD